MSTEPPEPLTYEEVMAAEALERGDVADAENWMRVKADVDQAPPLTQAQKDRLRVLLRPDAAQDREAA
jgi:hypothetical protein